MAGLVLVSLAACAGTGHSPGTSATPLPPEAAGAATATSSGTQVRATDLATELDVPWGIDFFSNGDALVSERDTGRILRVPVRGTGGPVAGGPGVRELGRVAAVPSAEGGLLGVALSPDERYVYAYYSSDQANQLVRFAFDGKSLGREEALLTGVPKAGIHNGGQVRFGPDGYLYVSTGDAANGPAAQDPTSLAGKILRLTPEGKPAPGNAWGNEVYTIGHRNVQGLAWDDKGRMWASELGQNTWDELNLITSGSNYGWPEVEGMGTRKGITDPMRTWNPGDASPSGLAWWRGSLWMGSLRGTTLWQVPIDAAGTTEAPVAHFKGEYGRLRAVGASGDAAPLVVGTSNRDGRGSPQPGDDRLLLVD
ncbi:Glucose/arabinose dehydrogenase, beta-propeller fold [Raineyella antarctica]|uniref:Glucose/arabinose dehydrogenase, beta-propeller fold n=2 Tax=Raineyella antarctica TaxID=1577474 RepID=A0A1G6H6D5_9ACTN|nr:Glucose/arabinose dehydrogenase, beta-propeller fold [Raineyella antarctica]